MRYKKCTLDLIFQVDTHLNLTKVSATLPNVYKFAMIAYHMGGHEISKSYYVIEKGVITSVPVTAPTNQAHNGE